MTMASLRPVLVLVDGGRHAAHARAARREAQGSWHAEGLR